MLSSASSTCGLSEASIAESGRLPSSSKPSSSCESACAAASAGSGSSTVPSAETARGGAGGLGGAGGGADMGGGGGGLRRGLGLAFGADGVHRFEIDDVAEQDLALVELVAPHGERLEG